MGAIAATSEDTDSSTCCFSKRVAANSITAVRSIHPSTSSYPSSRLLPLASALFARISSNLPVACPSLSRQTISQPLGRFTRRHLPILLPISCRLPRPCPLEYIISVLNPPSGPCTTYMSCLARGCVHPGHRRGTTVTLETAGGRARGESFGAGKARARTNPGHQVS